MTKHNHDHNHNHDHSDDSLPLSSSLIGPAEHPPRSPISAKRGDSALVPPHDDPPPAEANQKGVVATQKKTVTELLCTSSTSRSSPS